MNGPIPAQAGEPRRDAREARRPRAYPRAGGGTPFLELEHVPHGGLSPRRRGNRRRIVWDRDRTGPIPAQAGEPGASQSSSTARRAYPRAGGGTRLACSASSGWPGLSPRRRGNLPAWSLRRDTCGPIPAQAGEPCTRRSSSACTRAYPRAGGGTTYGETISITVTGLSPRRRGNRPRNQLHHRVLGPIPAQAGEPKGRPKTRRTPRAYPRAGGGTYSPALASTKS